MHAHYAFEACESEILVWWAEILAKKSFEKDLEDAAPIAPKNPYTIIMPPPNVTGSLHLGHALSSTFQDILVRFYRMNGRDVVWVPGTDHAGIATQMMVEKEVNAEGLNRQDMGREAFVERIWRWKDLYGGLILDQMKRLGFSADWDRACFTLDPEMNAAVNEAFVRLYDKGYVYRAQRLINWDGHLKTALSDLEVISKPVSGTLWQVAYSLVSDPEQHLVVATTRPETLFGDVAVAVHPDDERYAHLIGQFVHVPLTLRTIPIIADADIDPEKGTGAVKITPAHDFTDFQIGQRHHLPILSILTSDNRLNDQVPEAYRGMHCTQARQAVLKDLGHACVGETAIMHNVPYSERSGHVVEPRVTLQWFIDMHTMAERAIEAVHAKKIQFFPEDWANNALQWLKNIQPWCVSRQLWWGHRLPVWYGPENSTFVAKDADAAYAAAREKHGSNVVLTQDEDVLDTWFSSGLWPFSTLGWPNETMDLQQRLPTNVLVTGFDIIFFWVARMMMLGIEMTGRVPFKDVYIHPLIRDALGQKMSKTKKNVVNPLDIIQEYGADALRFALSGAACGKQHMRFSLKNVEQAQQFINKIWNIVRFAHGRGVMDLPHCPEKILHMPTNITDPLNCWMRARVAAMLDQMRGHIAAYRFADAARTAHHFVWHIVCDWYLEWAKREWNHPQRGAEVQAVFIWILGIIVRILHPFMPFITEKIWHDLTGEKGTLFQKSWPQCRAETGTHPAAEEEVDSPITRAWSGIHEIVVWMRRVRALFAVPSGQNLSATLWTDSNQLSACIAQYQQPLCQWLNVTQFVVHTAVDAVAPGSESRSEIQSEHESKKISGGASGVVFSLPGLGTLKIDLSDVLDMQGAIERLNKDLKKTENERDALEKRLHDFQNQPQTPEEILHDLQTRYREKQEALEYMRTTLNALSGNRSAFTEER